ncbi:hypothetical protein WR25_14073 [Diploscapter pachys]|uniref:Fatty acid hydroxylase domain-containing protein n=1 Tax=Diploscapter pachys TaxID=2018661 RepID=A0A2A2J6F0_9BILA|nr:hypothetical protein WR25_14073 [Diploscapter pachys]
MNGTVELIPFLNRIFSNTSLGHRLLERLTIDNLRHAFYLISPYETAVPTVGQVPNYNIEVSTWWFVFLFLEFLILFISGHEDRFAMNDTITSVCAGILSQCFKFGGRTIAIFLYVYIWNSFRLMELPWDSPWTWILCLFAQDFMYYLGHRAVHELGFFWGLHTIHHSSEYYNFSTALRQAAIQDAGLAIYDVLQLIGDMGPLGYVFNTPSHHRVHHGRNPYCIDKNFGGVFIIWDRMFGTFEAERKDDPPIYGLVHNEKTFNQLWLQFHVIWELLFFKGQMKDKKGEPIFPGIANKARTIKAALYPPGWFPGVAVEPFFHWMTMKNPSEGVPDPERPVVKYNPSLSWPWRAYISAHFVLLLCIFFHFEYDRPTLSWADFSAKIAFFVLTMQSFGSFFDRR